jgi:hypothetical protein
MQFTNLFMRFARLVDIKATYLSLNQPPVVSVSAAAALLYFPSMAKIASDIANRPCSFILH